MVHLEPRPGVGGRPENGGHGAVAPGGFLQAQDCSGNHDQDHEAVEVFPCLRLGGAGGGGLTSKIVYWYLSSIQVVYPVPILFRLKVRAVG